MLHCSGSTFTCFIHYMYPFGCTMFGYWFFQALGLNFFRTLAVYVDVLKLFYSALTFGKTK